MLVKGVWSGTRIALNLDFSFAFVWFCMTGFAFVAFVASEADWDLSVTFDAVCMAG